MTCDASVASPRKNFSRAGTFASSSVISTVVPAAAPTSLTLSTRPATTTIRVAARSCARRVVTTSRDTLAIDGSASPRNPIVAIPQRSSTPRIFEVACAVSASRASAGLIPQPSSVTRTRLRPPAAVSIAIVRAPASSALSTSSLTTLAGRSITSPAAIWSITSAGNTRITSISWSYQSGVTVV